MLSENKTKWLRAEIFIGDYTPPDIRLMRELQVLIEQDFRKIRDLEYYSRSLKVTLDRLNKLSRAHFGRSVYELLQERLHVEAVKLLSYTTLSVKQITFELGMNDPAYFFRCFKRITSVSPGEFRKREQLLQTEEQIPAFDTGC